MVVRIFYDLSLVVENSGLCYSEFMVIFFHTLHKICGQDGYQGRIVSTHTYLLQKTRVAERIDDRANTREFHASLPLWLQYSQVRRVQMADVSLVMLRCRPEAETREKLRHENEF